MIDRVAQLTVVNAASGNAPSVAASRPVAAY